jgi:hypothetical protein
MLKSHLPFTEDGLIEVVTERVSTLSPTKAWEEVLRDLAYLTDEERAESLKRSMWIVKPSAYKAGFHIDGDFRVVVIQGGWWYRGVTAVEPHDQGSKITYVVVNIAQGLGRWIAHFYQAASHRRSAR